MKEYVIWTSSVTCIVFAETLVRAIQEGIVANPGTFSQDWHGHKLSDHNPKIQAKIRASAITL